MLVTYNSSGVINNQTVALGSLRLFQHNPLTIGITNNESAPIPVTALSISGNLSLISGFTSGNIPTGTTTGYIFLPNVSGISNYSGSYTFTINTSGFTNNFNWNTASGSVYSNKINSLAWGMSPRGSFPSLGNPSGAQPRINYLTPNYKVWFNYLNYEVQNNNLIEFNKVGSNSGSVNNVYVSYLKATGSNSFTVAITGYGLTTSTTGFVLSSGQTATIVVSGIPSTENLTGRIILSSDDTGFTKHTSYLKQAVFTGSVFRTQVTTSGGYNIFDVVDARTSETVCRWHQEYSRAIGSVGVSADRCQTTSTGYIVPGGYDVEYTITNTGSVTGLIDDLRPIWRAAGPLSMFFYDFRHMGGYMSSGVSPSGTWYDNTPYFYPNDADLPFFVLEPSGTNRRIIVSLIAPYYKGHPYEIGGLRLHNYHATSSASNDIPNPEKHWSVTLLSRRASDDESYYIAPSSTLKINFAVRVQNQSDDVADAIFPYRQFYKSAIATGIYYQKDKTAIAGDYWYAVATHPNIAFFASGITDATGWTQVSGNVYNLQLTASGTQNFYWIWDKVNSTTAYPQHPTGDISSVNSTSGSWCVVSGSATGMILRIHSDISNVTGYRFNPTVNKPAYVPNRRVDLEGWNNTYTEMSNRSYSSGWPRLLNWAYGGRAPAGAPYSFNIAYDLLTRPDLYISGYYDIDKLKQIGSTSGLNVHIGAYWGLAAYPNDHFEYTSDDINEYNSLGLMTMAKEMDALKSINMKFVGLDAAPPSLATMDRAIQYLKFKHQYMRDWNPYGVITESSKSDILLTYAGTYGQSNNLMKSITVTTGTNTTSDLWVTGFGPKFIKSIFDDEYIWWGQIRTDLITTSPASLNSVERSLIVNKISTDLVSNNYPPLSLDANTVFSLEFIRPTGAIQVNNGPISYSALINWRSYIDDIWVDDIRSYKVYRSTDGTGYSLLGVAATSSYLDIGLTPESTYYYKISNITKYGRESDLSSGVSISFAVTGSDSFSSIGTTIPRIVSPVAFDPIGANGSFLMADSTSPEGVEWRVPCVSELTPDMEILSFTSNVEEVWTNQTLSSGSVTIFYTFNDSVSNLSLSILGGSTEAELALPTGGSTYNIPISLQNLTPNSSINLTLTAGNNCSSDSESIEIYWRQKVFYGLSSSGTLGSSHFNSFASIFSSNGNCSFALGEDEEVINPRIFFAFRSAAGTPKFTDIDSGLVGGFEFVENVSYTNPHSYTETYAVYRSVYTDLGSVNIQVTY